MVAAALADGTADRDCVFEVFARRLPHGRRYGVLAGTGRLLEALPHFRFGDDELAALRDAGAHRPAAAGLAGRLPLHRRHRRLRRGRPLLPRLAGADRPGAVRRGRAAGDPGAVGAQPRQRDRLGRRPHGGRRLRAAVHRDGLAAHARGGRGRRGPRRLPGRLRVHAPTSRPAGATASRRPAPARTPSRCCTTTSGRPSGRRWTPSAPGRRCSWTPTTSTRASGRRSRSPGPELGGDPAGLRRPAHAGHPRPRAARLPRRDEDPDRGHQRPRRVRHRRAHGRARSTATASAPRWSPARAPRRPAWSTSWSSATACRWPRSRRTRSRSAAASTPSAGTTPTGIALAEVVSSAPIEPARRRPRPRRPPGARRRGLLAGRRPAEAADRGPGRTTSGRGRRCRRRPGRCPAGEPVLETVTA